MYLPVITSPAAFCESKGGSSTKAKPEMSLLLHAKDTAVLDFVINILNFSHLFCRLSKTQCLKLGDLMFFLFHNTWSAALAAFGTVISSGGLSQLHFLLNSAARWLVLKCLS